MNHGKRYRRADGSTYIQLHPRVPPELVDAAYLYASQYRLTISEMVERGLELAIKEIKTVPVGKGVS